jgi:hypothetical protein
MTTRQLLILALDALEMRCGTNAEERAELIPAIRSHLAKPEPDPAGYFCESPGNRVCKHRFNQWADQCATKDWIVPLYRKDDV